MPAPIHIDYLADQPTLIGTLADWHHREWRHLRPGETLADREHQVRESARRDGPPLTVVALAEGEPLGSASLVAADMEIRPELTPWLASLYVLPSARRRGVGSALVRRIVAEAARLGVAALYLYTTSAENERLYASLGWTVRERVDYLGKRRVVMQIAAR